MPFFVVCKSWRGVPDGTPEVRLVAGCSSRSQAEGLAQAEAHAHAAAGRDPDTGAWWASDGGRLHEIAVTSRWPNDGADPAQP